MLPKCFQIPAAKFWKKWRCWKVSSFGVQPCRGLNPAIFVWQPETWFSIQGDFSKVKEGRSQTIVVTIPPGAGFLSWFSELVFSHLNLMANLPAAKELPGNLAVDSPYPAGNVMKSARRVRISFLPKLLDHPGRLAEDHKLYITTCQIQIPESMPSSPSPRAITLSCMATSKEGRIPIAKCFYS